MFCPYSLRFGEKADTLNIVNVAKHIARKQVIRLSVNWANEIGLSEVMENSAEQMMSRCNN